MRHVHERLRLWIDERRAPPADPVAHAVRQELRDEVGREHEDEEPRPPPEQSNDCRRDEEHDAVRPDPGEEDEEPVEPAESMVDYPALEVAVGPDQVGSSCLVWSISSCGLNGLPTKAWAPREAASAASCSSTFPLNMITGIAPTPWRSWTRRSISQPSTPGIITSRSTRSGDDSSRTFRPSSALPASRTA